MFDGITTILDEFKNNERKCNGHQPNNIPFLLNRIVEILEKEEDNTIRFDGEKGYVLKKEYSQDYYEIRCDEINDVKEQPDKNNEKIMELLKQHLKPFEQQIDEKLVMENFKQQLTDRMRTKKYFHSFDYDLEKKCEIYHLEFNFKSEFTDNHILIPNVLPIEIDTFQNGSWSCFEEQIRLENIKFNQGNFSFTGIGSTVFNNKKNDVVFICNIRHMIIKKPLNLFLIGSAKFEEYINGQLYSIQLNKDLQNNTFYIRDDNSNLNNFVSIEPDIPDWCKVDQSDIHVYIKIHASNEKDYIEYKFNLGGRLFNGHFAEETDITLPGYGLPHPFDGTCGDLIIHKII
ncbi:hypothetical protein QTN25_009150 [Entamoeba marina]